MSRIKLILALLLTAAIGNGRLLAEQPLDPADLDGTTWSSFRDPGDLGNWNESAVILDLIEVEEVGGRHFAAAKLWVFEPDEANAGSHLQMGSFELTGEAIVHGQGQRQTLTINFIDGDDVPRAGIRFLRGRKRKKKNQQRIVIRLYGSPFYELTKTRTGCDEPPDDDILEEEEEPLEGEDPGPIDDPNYP